MPKSVFNTVGAGAANVPSDVRCVQYLLNCVPAKYGGPEAELAVDGIAGRLTISAICRFQQRAFGFSDGRVDPDGKTIGALRPFDPLPYEQVNDPGQSAKGGKDAGGSSDASAGKIGESSSGKGGSTSDPWGFFNPGSAYYMKAGFAPAGSMSAKGDAFDASGGAAKSGEMAGSAKSGEAGGSAKSGETGASAGAGGKAAGAGAGDPNDPWGFFNPASAYFMKAGYAPGGKLGEASGGAAKSGGGDSGGGAKSGDSSTSSAKFPQLFKPGGKLWG